MPKMEAVGLDFIDRATHVVSTEVDVAASRDEVWTALVDNAGWVEWFGCSRCTGSPAIWAAPGDTRTIKLGPLVIDEIAVSVEARERWAMTFVRSNLPLWTGALEMVELFDTSREGEVRTELRWTGAFDFHPIAKPLASFIVGRAVETWGQGFENLAVYLYERR